MTQTQTNKVLLIGWDAADWKVITPLLDAGKMPNLKKFLQGGVMGNVATLYPILSPMLWTSIATGKRAYKHGIHGFVEPDPHTGSVRSITNLGRKTKAIWNILNQNGKRCNVVGWWPSHPVEPINGVMVSDHYKDANDSLNKSWPMPLGTINPERLVKSLKELRIHPQELDPEQLLAFVPQAAEIDQEKDRRLYSIATVLAQCTSVHAAATGLMQLEPWDFMAIYYEAIDQFCHGFMRYHPPKSPWISDRDFELYKGVVEAAYCFHDLMLGTLMTLAGEDTTIILCSDHGFHPDRLRPQHIPNEPAGPAEEHRPFGIFAMKGPGIKQYEIIFGASLLDITPTILTLYDLPISRDMDGKPLVTAWDKTPKVNYIDSWDDVPGDSGMHPPNLRLDPVDSTEALQQLIDLGYIEKLDESQEKQVANTVRELRYNLARSYIGGNCHQEAIPILEQLWEQHPEEVRFGIKLFDCFIALNKTEEAEIFITKALKIKEKVMETAKEELKQLAEKLKDKKLEEYSQAELNQLRKLRAKASVNPAAVAFFRGSLLYAQGKYEEAIRELHKAQNTQTHNLPSLYLKIGQAYLAQKDWTQAECYFLQVLELDPVNADAHLGLGRLYLKRHRNEDALQQLMAALGLIYYNPQAHCLCGVALYRCGRREEAIQGLQTAISQNPVFPLAYRYLAFIYRKHFNDAQKSAKYYNLARESGQRIKEFQAGISVSETPAKVIEWVASVNKPASSRSLITSIEETVVIVSGLPRSGTSMMMQMLAAGGLPVITDEVRQADKSNPKGYYEYEKAKQLGKNNAWIADIKGKPVKIVAQLLSSLPLGYSYRIIFMQRPLTEVIASQQMMLTRLGRKGSNLSPEKLAETYQKQLNNVEQILQHYRDVEVLSVNYHEAIANPNNIALQVNEFLGGSLNETAMASSVIPQLQHHNFLAGLQQKF